MAIGDTPGTSFPEPTPRSLALITHERKTIGENNNCIPGFIKCLAVEIIEYIGVQCLDKIERFGRAPESMIITFGVVAYGFFIKRINILEFLAEKGKALHENLLSELLQLVVEILTETESIGRFFLHGANIRERLRFSNGGQ
jgi:hypothetical protein